MQLVAAARVGSVDSSHQNAKKPTIVRKKKRTEKLLIIQYNIT